MDDLILCLTPSIQCSAAKELSEDELRKVLADCGATSAFLLDAIENDGSIDDAFDAIEDSGVEMDGYLDAVEDNLNFIFGL
jgi:hypothetical protein